MVIAGRDFYDVQWYMAREIPSQAKADVLEFLQDKNQINLWSADFFKNIIQKVNLE